MRKKQILIGRSRHKKKQSDSLIKLKRLYYKKTRAGGAHLVSFWLELYSQPIRLMTSGKIGFIL